MNEDIWALRLKWPAVTGGINQRGAYQSDDPSSGLNIPYWAGDDPQRVANNRRQVLRDMNAQGWPVVCAEQVHSKNIQIITRSNMADLQPCWAGLRCLRTDGLVTQEPHVVLNLTFADCVPVLLYCPNPLTIAVLHAGWRGTAAQIARRGVEVISSLGVKPKNKQAVIGPAICGNCYQVGPEVIVAMRDLPGLEDVMSHQPIDHVDLKELNRLTLIDSGVKDEAIEVSDLCTACGPVPLFSYRKSGANTGLQGAFAAITRC